MNRIARLKRLLQRYGVDELATYGRLKIGSLINRRSAPTGTTGLQLRLPLPESVAEAALRALAELSAPPVDKLPTVLRINRAAQVDLLGQIDRDEASWGESIAQAYAGGPWGWHPYSVATRVLVWVTAACARPRSMSTLERSLLAEAIADHVRFIGKHLETHLGGNHLLRELVAMVVGSEAASDVSEDPLGKLARRSLLDELERQFLEEAVHFENSPMYHGHALLDVAIAFPALGTGTLCSKAWRVLRRGLDALAAVTKPDGEYARFGDSTEGFVPSSEAVQRLVRAASGLSSSVSAIDGLLPGGLWTARWAGGRNWLGFRSWAHPPRTCPGHWHDDLLSVELCLGSTSVITAAGVYAYEADDVRAFSRSAAAHSTIDVGTPQAEKWGSFRIGSVSKSWAVSMNDASCEGFFNPIGRRGVVVSRRVRVSEELGCVDVLDAVVGLPTARVRYIFGPSVAVSHVATGLELSADGQHLATLGWEGAKLISLEEAPFYPRLGRQRRTRAADFEIRESAHWTIRVQ